MHEFSFPITVAAGAIPFFLTEIVTLVVAGALIAYISFRMKLVPIVGFLIAGVIIGPNAFALVKDQALVDATAEIGVILLLFTIGIEFSLEKLARIKRLIFGGGMIQVGLSIAVTTVVLSAFGVGLGAAVFTGMLVALSSTAIVLKLLADKGETNQEHGQMGLGLLIFQDLAIVVMVMLVPVLAGSDGGGALEIALALATAGAIIAVVLVAARKIMPRILEMVAKTCSPELFLLTVIAICFGTAYLTSLAGVSLSLGAFLAGLMVSESRFSQHALSETLPLQILFSATFFVSVGMLLDLSFLLQNLPIVLVAIVTVLLIKVATTWISLRSLGYATPVAAASALMLAQIGEFSFVLERVGREFSLFPAGSGAAGSQTFIAATVVLMVLTPGLMSIGSRISNKLVSRRELSAAAEIENEPFESEIEIEDHVVVAGYGHAARNLVAVLSGSGIPFVITTLSPDGANEAELAGLPVVRGDAAKPFLLRHVGIERAKMLVIADDTPTTAHRIISVARQLNPTMQIVVRTRYTSEADHLYEAGADTVIAEELESVVQLFGEVLRDYNIDATQIEFYEELARKDGYAALTDAGKASNKQFECAITQDCLDTRTFKLRDGAAAIGSNMRSLDSGSEKGLILKRVKRNGQPLKEIGNDFVFEAGDEIEMTGSTQAFANGGHFFRPRIIEPVSDTPAAASESAYGDFSPKAAGRTVVDIERQIVYSAAAGTNCTHVSQVRPVFPRSRGCEECLRLNEDWVHLRICLICGHVGCCDSSKNKHASGHYHEVGHPIIASAEPGEEWSWCFEDSRYV